MQEYNILLTWEAMYDIADITDYIEVQFGINSADEFQSNIRREIKKLGYANIVFSKTHILYRRYIIHKKIFRPSIIFYVIDEGNKEIHVLRVLREERDWEKILIETTEYTYMDKK